MLLPESCIPSALVWQSIEHIAHIGASLLGKAEVHKVQQVVYVIVNKHQADDLSTVLPQLCKKDPPRKGTHGQAVRQPTVPAPTDHRAP